MNNKYMHNLTCLTQDQWLLIDPIGKSVLSNFVDGYLVSFFFHPPIKEKQDCTICRR